MAQHPQAITSLPRSASDDRHSRMVRYSVTMGIRLVCVLMCVFARGWWLLIFAAGAVFLPYVAVVFANVVDKRSSKAEQPGALEITSTAAPTLHPNDEP